MLISFRQRSPRAFCFAAAIVESGGRERLRDLCSV
jgi:hypothetical protein